MGVLSSSTLTYCCIQVHINLEVELLSQGLARLSRFLLVTFVHPYPPLNHWPKKYELENTIFTIWIANCLPTHTYSQI